jgi:hypothetical protein
LARRSTAISSPSPPLFPPKRRHRAAARAAYISLDAGERAEVWKGY